MAGLRRCRKPKSNNCGRGSPGAAWSRIPTCAWADGYECGAARCRDSKVLSCAAKTAAAWSFPWTSSCVRWPSKWTKAMWNRWRNGNVVIRTTPSRKPPLPSRSDSFLMRHPFYNPASIFLGRSFSALIFGCLLLAGGDRDRLRAQDARDRAAESRAVNETNPHEPGPELRVSLSAGAITEILRQEPGLMLAVKRLLVRTASERGRVV